MVLAGLGLIAASAGCQSLNDSSRVSRAGSDLELLEERQQNPLGPIDFAKGGDRPSINSLERGEWAATRQSAGFYQVESYPFYGSGVTGPRYLDGTARQRGAFPTVVSSTETFAEGRQLTGLREGLAGPAYALLDLVLIIPRAFMTPPWEVISTRDGTEPMQRAPRSSLVDPAMSSNAAGGGTGAPGCPSSGLIAPGLDPAGAPQPTDPVRTSEDRK